MQQRKQKLLCVLCVFHDNADRLWLLCDVLWDNYDMFVYYLTNIHTNKLNVHRWSQQTPRKITIVIVVCWLTVVKCAFSPLDSPDATWSKLRSFWAFLWWYNTGGIDSLPFFIVLVSFVLWIHTGRYSPGFPFDLDMRWSKESLSGVNRPPGTRRTRVLSS